MTTSLPTRCTIAAAAASVAISISSSMGSISRSDAAPNREALLMLSRTSLWPRGYININNSVLRPAGAPPAPVTPLLISVRSPEHHLEHHHQRRRPLAFGASQLR
ncbi:hypothetical protein ACLKA6_012957 [Drosophila palustris]